jgi:hypothetical protein
MTETQLVPLPMLLCPLDVSQDQHGRAKLLLGCFPR